MTSRARNSYDIRGGIGVPAGYGRYPNPFDGNKEDSGAMATAMAGAHAKIKLIVLSNTIADFDGKTLQTQIVTRETVTNVTLTFDDDAAPPSTASAINIQGLATIAAIADQIQLAFELNGCRVVDKGAGELWIYQPVPGDAGNVEILCSDFTGELQINNVTDFTAFNPKWYGGVSFDQPVLWGKMRGMAAGEIDNLQRVPVLVG